MGKLERAILTAQILLAAITVLALYIAIWIDADWWENRLIGTAITSAMFAVLSGLYWIDRPMRPRGDRDG